MGRGERNTKRSNSRARRSRFERLEQRHLLAVTPIEVLAAGRSGAEQMQLEIDGAVVQTWNNVGGDYGNRVFESFTYTHPTEVTADRIRVVFSQGSGVQNDLRVDGIRVSGEFFESESPTTFATGTFDSSTGECTPRFAQSEEIHCLGGAFEFDLAAGTRIAIDAAGQTGEETLALEIDGQRVATFENVGGDYSGRVFQRLAYTHPTSVSIDQLRVVLVDGRNTASGGDRNLRIDAVELGGQRFETEAAGVFSVGSFRSSDGCDPGFKQSEDLHCSGGYFEFPPAGPAGSQIEVRAAGSTGQETLELQIDGVTVQTFTGVGGNYNQRQFVAFNYTHDEVVTADRIRVAFTNDAVLPSGADRNLRVDGITLDGVVFESEAANVLSTGTFSVDNGCGPGFKQSDTLHCNGHFQFEAAVGDPGVIGIGSTQFTVGEGDGVATVTFVRTDGADGPATVDFTTVPATATPGLDYVSRSGTVTFADGQTQRSVDITILNDGLGEGTETFNLAIDRVTGAAAGQPRTTTITIIDDEQPSPGTGNGLLGEYFNGRNFDTGFLARTDATVNFDWGRGSPASVIPADNFSVRWSGQIEPLFSETYTFSTTTDDGVRLWVNDVLIINQFVDQPATTHSGQIALEAGVRYDIRMEYYEATGDATAVLRWSSPRQALQVVPRSQLYSTPIVPTAGTFVGETVVSGLNGPTAIEFAPNGQLFVAQKDGVVRVVENGQLLPQAFIDLSAEVNNVQDRGLLGLELDPDFPNNPYVYLLYTYDPPETLSRSGLAGPDGAGNRVARLLRVTADASNNFRTVVPGSGVVLLGENSVWQNISNPDRDGTNDVGLPPSCNGVEDCLPVDSRSHSIGALQFAPDGSLFITNGDGTSFGRVDPRTVRVQDLDNLAGKVLRIDPATGRGLSDNPFFDPASPDSNRSKVYNYGLRNPFRLAVHPVTGEPYVGDVGWNAWEEINAGRGQNFGWPFFEGGGGQNLQTGGYNQLPSAAAFYANNNATPPLWSRSHAAGGVAVVLGDFYTGDLYPSQFQNALFFTDFGDPTIRALELNQSGTAVVRELFVSGSVGTVVEMTMGPDGLMYYVDLAGGRVGRLQFQATATAAASVAFVTAEPSPASVLAFATSQIVATEPPVSGQSTTGSRGAQQTSDDGLLLLHALGDGSSLPQTPVSAFSLHDDELSEEPAPLPALDEAFAVGAA